MKGDPRPGWFGLHRAASLPISVRTTSPAIIMPATPGTKLMLPGVRLGCPSAPRGRKGSSVE